jgi:hypothetical protein
MSYIKLVLDLEIQMKKLFTVPSLKNHGALEEITQAYGSSSATDTVFFNGKPFNLGSTGSSDGVVIPK